MNNNRKYIFEMIGDKPMNITYQEYIGIRSALQQGAVYIELRGGIYMVNGMKKVVPEDIENMFPTNIKKDQIDKNLLE